MSYRHDPTAANALGWEMRDGEAVGMRGTGGVVLESCRNPSCGWFVMALEASWSKGDVDAYPTNVNSTSPPSLVG